MAVERLSKSDLEQMLDTQRVDVGNATLFGIAEDQRREPQRTKLTLVISTGGSGMSSIKEAMKIANQKLNKEYSQFVKFFIVDSATGELETMAKQGMRTINLSVPGAATRVALERREELLRTFMPANYNTSIIADPEGAGQDRMTGKVKLYDKNVDKGQFNDSILRKAIENLFTDVNEWAPYAKLNVQVMILTGISGGNGSGTFQDLATIAREACKGDNRTVSVFGYIMLPDTAEKFAPGRTAQQSLHRNGYAALKELESKMSLQMIPDGKQIVKTHDGDIEITNTNLPFNFPVLISGDYNKAVSMIAETIVNSVADNGTFSQDSFFSNIVQMRGNFLSPQVVAPRGVLIPGQCPEDSHSYCGIGFAQASIPEKIVIPNVIAKVVDKLYVPDQTLGLEAAEKDVAFCNDKKRLNRPTFEKQIRVLFGIKEGAPLAADSVWKYRVLPLIRKYSALGANQMDITYDDVAQGNGPKYVEGFKIGQKSSSAIEKLQEELKTLYNSFLGNAKTVMKLYGPRAIEYLYLGKGEIDRNTKVEEDLTGISIRTMLEEVKVQAQKLNPGKYPAKLDAVGILGRTIATLISGKLTEWKNATQTAAQNDVYYTVGKAMTGTNGIWDSEFTSKVEDFYTAILRFADVVETMTAFYKSQGKSLDADDFQTFAASAGEENSINLCSDQGVYGWVRNNVNAKINQINIQGVKEALVDDFFNHPDLWTSNEIGRARKQYDELLSATCEVGSHANAGNGLSLTITDYFNEVLDGVGPQQQTVVIDNHIKDIMSRLLTTSKPALKLRDGVEMQYNRIIMIPQSLATGQFGTQVTSSFERYKLTPSDQVVISPAVDAIVCYQTAVAVALSDLKELQIWEDDYFASITSNSSVPHLNVGERVSEFTELTKTGTDAQRHVANGCSVEGQEEDMIFGTGLAWVNYPSVALRRYEGDFMTAYGTRENEFRVNTFVKKVDKAIELGIIEEVVTGHAHQFFMNVIPKEWHNLDVSDYENFDDNGKPVYGTALFTYLQERNRSTGQSFRKPIVLQGSPFFAGAFDFTSIVELEPNSWNEEREEKVAKEYMMRVLRKNTYLYLQMEDTLYRFYDMDKAIQKNGEQLVDIIKKKKEKETMEAFFDLYRFGVIATDEKKMKWTVKKDKKGNADKLVEFGFVTKSKMAKPDAKALDAGLKLYYAFTFFKDWMKASKASLTTMEDLRMWQITSTTDESALEEFVQANAAAIQEEAETFNEVVGLAEDKAGELHETFGVSADVAEALVTFYEAAQD